MPPKKILIIDDEPAIQMLYNEEFVDAGYTVASAYNGEEGLAAFTDNPPDLVILDINMPRVKLNKNISSIVCKKGNWFER